MTPLLIIFFAGFSSFLLFNHVLLAILVKPFYLVKLKNITVIKKGNLVSYAPGVALFIFVAVSSIFFFVISKANTIPEALVYGGVLGFILYSFHNFFNLHLIRGHQWKLAVVDTAIGTCIVGLTSAVMLLAKNLAFFIL